MERGKHILFLASWFPVEDNPSHGIFILRHARAAALYNRVSVIYLSPVKDAGEQQLTYSEEENVHIIRAHYPDSLYRKNTIMKFIQRLILFQLAYRLLIAKRGKPGLVQLNVVFPAGIWALYIYIRYRVPFVIMEHWSGYLPEDGNYKGFFRKLISRICFRKSKAIATVSDAHIVSFKKLGLCQSATIMENTVDTNIFKPFVVLPKKNFRFLHISSLVGREKNVSGIIRAFQTFRTEINDAELFIGGDGPDRAELEKQAGPAFEKSGIFFTRSLQPEEVALQMNNADCFVLFSHFEGMPAVIMESLCCGLPVISSNTGHIAKMISAKDGIVLYDYTENALLRAMKEMYHKADTFNRADISRRAGKYAYAEVGKKLDQFYASAL